MKHSANIKYYSLILILLFTAVSTLSAQEDDEETEAPVQVIKLPPVLQSFSDQMTAVGYKCIPKPEDGDLFLHCEIPGTEKPDFRIHEYNGGFRVFTFYISREEVTYESEALRNLVNEMNENALISRYYIDKDADVAAEFWYPLKTYDKNIFSVMMESFFQDWTSSIEKFSEKFQQLFD
jgi:hypothetical protein